MKAISILCLIAALVFAAFVGAKISDRVLEGIFGSLPESQNCSVAWYGDTDLTMLKQVRQDLISTASCKVTSVSLFSQGGPVLTSIEIAREVRRAQENGRIIKIHGRTLIASGAVLVLGSGTKGYRSVDKYAFTLVHGVHVSTFFDFKCIPWNDNPVTSADIQNQLVLSLYVQELVTISGHSLPAVKTWIACDRDWVGLGFSLVIMGIADATK